MNRDKFNYIIDWVKFLAEVTKRSVDVFINIRDSFSDLSLPVKPGTKRKGDAD